MATSEKKPRRFDREVDGILLLDKPTGMTSNAALQKARGLFRALKAGHAGSLDPLASGMLPVCFGHATKVCAFLLDANKSYRFTARLGERSDTGDADGTIVERKPIPQLTEASVLTAFRARTGRQQQVPPMYSALKHQGRRLYELAREGATIDRTPRYIVIEALELVRFDDSEVEAVVRCSKGTYIRTLAEDIAADLGTVAHLTALRRLQVDPFGSSPMHEMQKLEMYAIEGAPVLETLLIPSDRALMHLSAISFDQTEEQALLHGKAVPGGKSESEGNWVRMYGPEHGFLGLGETTAGGDVQPRRLFVNSTPNPSINS